MRSTISVLIMKSRLNLVRGTSDNPQIWRLSTQIERAVAAPELGLKLCIQVRQNKHTMQAGNKIGKPRSRGKCGNDLVTLPDRHTESTAINQKGTSLKHLLTCAEETGLLQIRILNMRTTAWPQGLRDAIGKRVPTYIDQGNICLDGISV